MNRYIFLDIDGVLNTYRHQRNLAHTGRPTRDNYLPFFDPSSVENLGLIIQKTEADIIITSSWRNKGLDIMEQVWHDRKLPGMLVGLTPTIEISYYCTRGMEIMQWLTMHAEEDYQYVIIDDGSDFLPEQISHLVQTNPNEGISKSDVETAVNILLK